MAINSTPNPISGDASVMLKKTPTRIKITRTGVEIIIIIFPRMYMNFRIRSVNLRSPSWSFFNKESIRPCSLTSVHRTGKKTCFEKLFISFC